jgi:hypothetical protein
MLSTLLQTKRSRRRIEETPIFSTPQSKRAHAKADWTEDDSGDDLTDDDDDDNDDQDNRR